MNRITGRLFTITLYEMSSIKIVCELPKKKCVCIIFSSNSQPSMFSQDRKLWQLKRFTGNRRRYFNPLLSNCLLVYFLLILDLYTARVGSGLELSGFLEVLIEEPATTTTAIEMRMSCKYHYYVLIVMFSVSRNSELCRFRHIIMLFWYFTEFIWVGKAFECTILSGWLPELIFFHTPMHIHVLGMLVQHTEGFENWPELIVICMAKHIRFGFLVGLLTCMGPPYALVRKPVRQ